MGPKNASSHTDLPMGEIDHKAKFCGPIKPALWWCYCGDIFDLWQQGLPALKTFTQYINSLYATIKFELVFSDSHLHVLDITLHLIDGFIRTDVYSKPTDSHLLYLPPLAPTHDMYKPFGVALRFRRNCSKDDFLSNRCKEYKGYLVNQGYPVNLVDNQFSKALTITRKDLLKQKVRASKKIFPFVMTFNPMLPDLNYIIKKHLHFLESNPKLKELFPKNSIIPSYGRSKNLKEILAPSKFESTPSQRVSSPAGGCFKCDKNRM